ncbi:uncharacterized protein TNCV_415921 [Trichonephila clavipes]|nr:uncharacterized protein TNCV_415921 [Trichonephila clavipes]
MSEAVPLSKAESALNSGPADGPIQCRSKYKCYGTHSSMDITGYGTAQQTSPSRAAIDEAFLSTTPTVGPGTSRLDHGLSSRMNHYFSFITTMVVLGCAVYQANSYFPYVLNRLYSRL